MPEKILKYIGGLIVIGIVFWIGRSCESEKHAGDKIVKTDTVSRITNMDWFYEAWSDTVKVPVPVKDEGSGSVEADTVYKDTTDCDCHQIKRTYSDSAMVDSSKIWYETTVMGKLLGQSFRVKPRIKEVTVTERIETETRKPPASKIFATTRLGMQTIAPGLTYVRKNNWYVGADYNVIQENVNITIGKSLW